MTDPIVIYFDSPMDRASTEKAFSISGEVRGTFTWSDNDRTLTFRPDRPLERAQKYAVKIDTSARSKAGLALAREVVFNVETVGYLEVTQVLPAPETADAAVDSVITVMFNRPVVPLTDLANQADLPNPLTLTPAVEGRGEWLNTSIYVFRPSQPLAGGQTYTGRVAAGLNDVTGGTLEKDFEWRFTVAAPGVISTVPEFGAQNVSLTTPISITFNQPMDRAATEAAFRLIQLGQVKAGSFRWSEDGYTLGFIPAEPLSLNSTYEVVVGSGSQAAGGGATIGGDFIYSFTTVLPPAIRRTEPADGEQGVDIGSGFRIYFASPMDVSTLDPNIEIIPEPTQVYTYWSDYDFSYYIGWNFKPSTQYQVTLRPGMKDPYGNDALTAPRTVTFTTGPLRPELYINARGGVGVYSAYLPAEVFITTVNVDVVNYTLYPLTLNEFARLTGPDSWQYAETFQPSAAGTSGSLAIETKLNEAILTKIPLQPNNAAPAPGLYYLRLEAPGLPPVSHILVVSRNVLTLKTGLDEAFIWATDLNSGRPTPNLPLTLYDAGFKRLGEGRTNAQGVLQLSLPKRESVWDTIYAVGPEGEAFTVALSDWSNGLEPWDFNLAANYYAQELTAYLYTDRPIYRPGQVVFFKGVLRREEDARFRLPDVREVFVQITNDRGEAVYRSTLPLSSFGTFSGEFKLAGEASLGFYSITARESDADDAPIYGSVSFSVAEFRRPEFQVAVSTPKDEVVQGETIPVTVEASFFFGGPVSNAPVRWVVLAADYLFPYEPAGGAPPGYYDFTDFDWTAGDVWPIYGTFGRIVMEKEAVTDAQGRAVLEVPATLADSGTSQRLTIEATVTDVSGQPVSGRVEVIVHQGEFYIGARPAEYVGKAGTPLGVELVTVNWDSTPKPNQRLRVEFFEHEWNCALETDPETGNVAWTCNAKSTPVGNTEVTTGANGTAATSFTPAKGGTYKIVVSGVDSGGRTIKTATYAWVAAADNAYVTWRQSNDDRITPVADKRSYKPGETAEILIPSPFQGEATALVTVERGGVLKHEVITLRNNSTTYQLPITADFAPEVYFSVVIVKGVDSTNPAPALKLGIVKLLVSPEQQLLKLTLTPDKTKVGPRDTVNYTLKATDYTGKPVQAEFSVSVVDLAVLQLSAPNAQPIEQFFYGERGLGVRTASGLTLSINRLNVQVARAKGGGGGVEAGFDEVRSRFDDTAFWRASVTTDANGEATFSVTLPDNLTTWRLDARGLTADTLVGQSTVDIVATKDLLIRPVTPRFFVVGDRAELAAVVNNNTPKEIQATVTLDAHAGVTLDGEAAQTVTIPANGRVEVTWNVTVQDAPAADLTFRVEGGGLRDASKPTLAVPPEQLLPILKYSAPETVGTAGELADATPRLEAISLPRRYDVTQGNLRVEVAPSLAAATTPALTALENPEYDHVEAIVSSFLPNVVSLRAFRKLNLADAALESRLNALVSEAVQKLLARQNVDGGWGWWGTDQSDPYLTAYVLFGLSQARQNGFSVSEGSINNAVSYLQGQLINPRTVAEGEEWLLNRQAFILYALADAGRPDISATVQLYDVRPRLDSYAKAYLALTLAQAGSNDPRVRTLLSDLNNAAILSATGAHWEERRRDRWNLNTDTRSTAIILMTLARLDPQNQLIPNVVRWLMTARTAQVWETSQETVWAVIALTDWMDVSGELKADYNYRVSLNGNVLFADQATAANLREEKVTEVAVAELFKDQANRLVFERGAGEGRLYYTAHLNLYLPVSEVRAVSRGIIVGRTYSIIRDDCGGKDQPACPPVTEARAGDDIRVKVTLIAPNDLYYVVLEDPIPAGTEPVDTSLLTTSVVGQPPELDPRDPFYYGWGWWWFSKTEIRDEKVVLFADYLPRGTYEYTYTLHASRPGEYQVLPTWARENYFPEVFGRGDGMVFTIRP
ncbi:MAG: Ig-like domain-containing protein [Anaerolineales bacterium]|nr:Ig-like domain-containing protein [Anaerolineales bacterium]